MLTSTLRTVGGSVMMAIPKSILEGLGLSSNEKVALHIDGGRLVVEPRPKPKYTLDELLAQCQPIQSDDDKVLQDWDTAEPVGREMI
jgi:antitoxin ChpS